MGKPIRVLIVEESIPKTTLLVAELEEGGYYPINERIDSQGAMEGALDNGKWDVVIADYNASGFDAMDALAVLNQRGIDVPFIVVTDPIGQGIAAAALQAGADDIVMRSNLVRLVPVVERTVREATDRKERKRAEDALEETRRYLVSLIESSTDAIISTNKEGLVVLFNRGAEALLGYRRKEVVGRRVTVLYESDDEARRVRDRVLELGGKVSAHETNLRSKAGQAIPVLISASLLFDEEGEKSGTVGFIKDLRERKRAEEELRAAHRELQRAYDSLEQAQAAAMASEKLAALGRLTVGVSREILGPLKEVTMQLQGLIEDPATRPKNIPILKELDERADRIVKVSRDLLYFARLRPPEHQPLDLNETVGRALSLMERDIKEKGISVELEAAERLPAISADHDQVYQVVLHLLANARDAMGGNGGRLSLATCVVQARGGRFVELKVEDTGRGIPPEHLDKLFDPFFTTKDEEEKTGLGLAICQGIVETHGGTIRAESEVGRGTAFVVRLPLARAEESP
jgi:two-component system NtrC family sensor kinase